MDLTKYNRQLLEVFTDAEIDEIKNTLLKLINYPCHNRAAERHLKIVTETLTEVVGFEKRNCLVRQNLQVTKIDEKIRPKAAICCAYIFTTPIQQKFSEVYHFKPEKYFCYGKPFI